MFHSFGSMGGQKGNLTYEHLSRKNHLWAERTFNMMRYPQHFSGKKHFFTENVLMLNLISQNVLLPAEMSNMFNMWNLFGPMGDQKGPNRDNINKRNQHLGRSPFFRKGIQHDETNSTVKQKRAHCENNRGKWFNMAPKVVLSGKILQHGPKSVSFRGNN